MQVGKARHWKDVLKMLTKGKTDRLSAEPMLNYFKPLQMWLRIQNRDENIIGWNTSSDDIMLFQPLKSKSNAVIYSKLFVIVTFVTAFLNFI